jgi:hypothetical protein
MVIMLASGAVDRGFELQLGQTKDYKIGNANSAIFQLYHVKIKLTFNEMMMRSILY